MNTHSYTEKNWNEVYQNFNYAFFFKYLNLLF